MRNLIQSVFSSDNPFLARVYDFWQAGLLQLKAYEMTADWNPLTALAVGALPTTPIVIDAQIDFLLLAMNFIAFPTTGSQTSPQATPNMLLNITDKGNANLFSDVDHHVSLWTGSTLQTRSYKLPFPRLLTGPNQIQTKLTDNGGTACRCFLGFKGVRIQYEGTTRSDVFPSS